MSLLESGVTGADRVRRVNDTSNPVWRAALEQRIRSHDRAGAISVAFTALDEQAATVSDLYQQLSEILVEVGAEWQRGTTEVWQEHLITGIVRNIVEACVLAVEEAAPPDRRSSVVLAAPSDEYHDLGLRMLTDRFILAGWQAHFLGANVPVDELIAAADELAASAVALSASTHFHRVGLNDYVSILTGARPALRVWVGGPAFAREHAGWSEGLVLDPLAIPSPEDR